MRRLHGCVLRPVLRTPEASWQSSGKRLVVITNITETFIGQESVQGRFVSICLSLIPDSRLEHLIRCLRHSLPRRLEPALLERDALWHSHLLTGLLRYLGLHRVDWLGNRLLVRWCRVERSW